MEDIETIKKHVADEGYRAASKGEELKDNPWSVNIEHDLHFAWRSGWLEYKQECM